MKMADKNPFEKIPNLGPQKAGALFEFARLLREANAKVNLLSRKDTDDLEYRHVAFCAAISAFFTPSEGARIADVGSGGGLPGIVMAILYPQAEIAMFDGVGKKIAMVNEMCERLSLKKRPRLPRQNRGAKGGFRLLHGQVGLRAACVLRIREKKACRRQKGVARKRRDILQGRGA